MSSESTRRAVIATLVMLIVAGIAAIAGAGAMALRLAVLAIAHIAGLILIKVGVARLRDRRRVTAEG